MVSGSTQLTLWEREMTILIPEIFKDGVTEEIKLMLDDRLGIDCITDISACDDISEDDCEYCILHPEGKAKEYNSFNKDPIQWMLTKKFITKAQAFELTLEGH